MDQIEYITLTLTRGMLLGRHVDIYKNLKKNKKKSKKFKKTTK